MLHPGVTVQLGTESPPPPTMQSNGVQHQDGLSVSHTKLFHHPHTEQSCTHIPVSEGSKYWHAVGSIEKLVSGTAGQKAEITDDL